MVHQIDEMTLVSTSHPTTRLSFIMFKLAPLSFQSMLPCCLLTPSRYHDLARQ